MKLIVQIPCYNEEQTLAQTIADIPRTIPGVDRVEVLVVDDGSADRTVEVARRAGADHIIRHAGNRGLAASFRTGLLAALRSGADIIVNTDGDNQYPGEAIPQLIAPILAGKADIVVGDRDTAAQPHFSPVKRWLQRYGSAVVRRLSGVNVPDAVSGFRALSRDAALKINIVSNFSYTIEMLIQAGEKRLAVTSVRTGARPTARGSRLFRNVPQFVFQSAVTALRVYAMYRPLRAFSRLGGVLLIVGTLPVLRFVWLYLHGEGQGHVQSLVVGGALMVIGCITLLAGLLADLIGFNRKLLEQALESARRRELAAPADAQQSDTARRSPP